MALPSVRQIKGYMLDGRSDGRLASFEFQDLRSDESEFQYSSYQLTPSDVSYLVPQRSPDLSTIPRRMIITKSMYHGSQQVLSQLYGNMLAIALST